MALSITSLARDYVRSRATSVMEYECRVERVTKGNHDEETLVYTAGGRSTQYEGKVRIWEVSGASAIAIGDAEVMLENTQASFPHDAPLFKKDDEIVITAVPVQDSALMGARFQIQTASKAGELRSSRRYSVTSVQR